MDSGHFGHRDGAGKFATGTVRQRDCDHLAPFEGSARRHSAPWAARIQSHCLRWRARPATICSAAHRGRCAQLIQAAGERQTKKSAARPRAFSQSTRITPGAKAHLDQLSLTSGSSSSCLVHDAFPCL